MTLKIFRNQLDATDCIEREFACLLTEWMSIREQYPNARLYKGAICVQNDITPKTRDEAWALLGATGNYQVLSHAKDPVTLGVIAAVISVGVAVYTYNNMPDMPATSDVSGSPNNSLAQRQNKHRVNERVADIYGRCKVIPDLISPVYRYYKDNIQVEECRLTIGNGSFAIDSDTIKEGETPINTIEGASISIYEPGQSLMSDAPQIQIGSTFDEMPIVTKQVSAIDGKQTLRPPSSGEVRYNSVIFTPPNTVTVGTVQGTGEDIEWTDGGFTTITKSLFASFTKEFGAGEKVIINGAAFGSVSDSTISGNTDVDITDGVFTIASKLDISNPNSYKKIRISSLLVDDESNGTLNLAGEYPVSSISKSGGAGAYIYVVTLATGFKDVNPSFYLLTTDTSGVTSGVLTDNVDNIDLSGEYTISSLTDAELTLVNPAAVNSNWNRLNEVTTQQATNFLSKTVSFNSSKDNFIGWYYAGSKDSTGLLLNFLAANGIYQNDIAQQVAVEVEYQMVVDGVPTGPIYKYGDVMQGVANNRNPIGMSLKKALPAAGQFRFRVRRVNDNRDYKGNDGSLIDDVIFESAYSYYETTKLVYEHDTTIRLHRMAIGSGTNGSELNMIAHRKLDTRDGFMATSDFADIAIAIATDPYIGRMSESEIDRQAFYDVSAAIAEYFGTNKACEFNYTFDDKYASYQEMIFAIAEAVFCTARREGGLHFFNFERETPNSLVLFNHRNSVPESMAVTEFFGIQDNYDGVEFKWRDPDEDYSEAIIRLPDDLRTNYKTVTAQGVTNSVQAHFLANRAWNKLKFNRKAIEFTAYGEGDLVTRTDRIAVVDTTVPMLCSGQIEAHEGTILTLDYPALLDANTDYVIHLQLKNGVVDVIDIVGQLNDYQIVVSRIPMQELVTAGVTHTAFSITKAVESESEAYLISEKTGRGLFESTISATAYDPRYYQNDSDYKKGLVA